MSDVTRTPQSASPASADGSRPHRMTIRLSREETAMAEAVARDAGLTVSDVVRQSIRSLHEMLRTRKRPNSAGLTAVPGVVASDEEE